MLDPSHRYAWLKLNAYGVVLAGLATLAIVDLIKPGGADLARLVGRVPPGQGVWATIFIVSGLALFYGFLRRDRLAETAGLSLMVLGVALQTAVAYSLLGWTDFTTTRVLILGIVSWCLWARSTVLWSRDGLTFTIPPRRGPHHPPRRR